MLPSILTRSYDLARTGANDAEATLSATSVRTRGVNKLFSIAIPDDPRLDAQPLIVAGFRMPDGNIRDLLIQASMGNTVYAFDAHTGAELWRTHLGRAITSTRAIDGHLTNVLWGILSTPAIDTTGGLIYVCTWISPDGDWHNGQHFLAALRLDDGGLAHPLLNLEGAIYDPGHGLPAQRFVSAARKQRAALTLTHGAVLIPFGTIAESASTARGWMIAVDTTTFTIAATWCSTVTGSGGGIWQSGAGPAIAPDGGIYVMTGNGAFNPAKGDFSESVVKLTYTPPRPGHAGKLTVGSWWTPWTDSGRTGGNPEGQVAAEPAHAPLPTNVQLLSLLGHAQRLGMDVPGVHHLQTDGANTGPHVDDAANVAAVTRFLPAMMGGADWGDQDFGSGGPVIVSSAGVALTCGKDGILYSVRLTSLGDTEPTALAPATTAANYAKLIFPPILYTYFDPTMQPAPTDVGTLNKFPGGATRHLHGAPLVWHSIMHGTMHFVGGENSPLRAWSIDAFGATTYLAGSNEIASPQSPRPSGGMPGWSITLAGNVGRDGIVVAMVPYQDANMGPSPSRFLIYDAQNFGLNADGSRSFVVLWDSENWGPEHAFTHPKFNRPVVWNGRIYRPTYDGRIDVYG